MRYMFDCKKASDHERNVLFLEFLSANVTSCPNELTGVVIKVTSILKHRYSSVDRVLNFFSVESSLFQEYFVFFFHRWTFERQN